MDWFGHFLTLFWQNHGLYIRFLVILHYTYMLSYPFLLQMIFMKMQICALYLNDNVLGQKATLWLPSIPQRVNKQQPTELQFGIWLHVRFLFLPQHINKKLMPQLRSTLAVFPWTDIGNHPRKAGTRLLPPANTHCLQITHGVRKSKASNPRLWPWERFKQFNPIRRWQPRGSCSKFGRRRTISSPLCPCVRRARGHALNLSVFLRDRRKHRLASVCLWRPEHINKSRGT